MSHDLKDALAKIAKRQNLDLEESYGIFHSIFEHDDISDVQIAALLMGLRVKGETVDELTGAVRAMREHALTVPIPEQFDAMDCCGTGGDGTHSLNVSTAVAFVLAGCGVKVAKHGNRASSSSSGSADVLESLGVNINCDVEKNALALERANVCFIMAAHYHPALKKIAPIRKKIGTRTLFNLMGPLTNPADVKRQLLGVFSKDWLLPVAQTLRNLGHKKAWVVHAENGMDEISLSGKTYVASLDKETISELTIDPADYGFTASSNSELRGGDPSFNAKALMDLLEGKKSAYRDIVLLNAAAGLVVADKSSSIEDGLALAATAIDNGQALQSFELMTEITND